MKISILTLFPDMMGAFFKESIIKRAMEKNQITIEIINIRDYALDSYGTVDDKPYGGGAGMVMRVDVISRSLEKTATSSLERVHKIITSPRGVTFNQKKATEYSENFNHIIILCGHYEGVDERVSKLFNEEVSLGDFVMTGGEITAAAIVDSIVRLLPGVIKKDSPQEESFSEVPIEELEKVVGKDYELLALQKRGELTVRLLEYPHYTRPEEFEGDKVPDVLLSGHHQQIKDWRLKQAYLETKKRRPDLLR